MKNDHLGFEIVYIFKGVVRKYRPDFLIRLANGTHLILEVKGQDVPEAKAKHNALGEWVAAINAQGGFGGWNWHVSFNPSDVDDKLALTRKSANRRSKQAQSNWRHLRRAPEGNADHSDSAPV